MTCKVFLFGESEKGEYCSPLTVRNLEDLYMILGHPPKESAGIQYAIQSLLCNRELIFYRVHEEGFSVRDYTKGIQLLAHEGAKLQVSAVSMPGVGDHALINALSPICSAMRALLLVSEQDFYDYLTGVKY